jgi:predicted nucleic acid-binding protein
MILVVDTNIVIAAAIKPSITQAIILNDNCNLYSPEFLRDEIQEHKEIILKKTSYSDGEFERIMSLIFSEIEIIPKKRLSLSQG